MRRWVCSLRWVPLVAFVACATVGPPAVADAPEQRLEGVVRVRLREVDGNIFKFTVYNLSGDTMTLDRDALRLCTADGPRSRLPGGKESVYTVPAGGAHDLNVRFPTAGLPDGTRLAVEFDNAITRAGHPVPLSMAFTVGSGEGAAAPGEPAPHCAPSAAPATATSAAPATPAASEQTTEAGAPLDGGR